jgi:hypothetical protein
MPAKGREGPLVLLDACCLINLLASGRCEQVLGRLPYRFATSRLVATQEILTLAQADEADGPLVREAISPARLESMEELALLDLATADEIAGFVRFAAELDDGEASVCALAIVREGTVATDDRKALRVLGRVAPGVPSLQTPEILHAWAHLSRATEREIAETLLAVRRRGRFHPHRDAPRFDWWESFFR